MVIRARVEVTPDILRKRDGKVVVQRLTDEVRSDFLQAAEEQSNPIIKFIRTSLDTLPAKSKHPFVWSNNISANDRARRWWFGVGIHTLPTANNRYVRQGNLQKAFDVDYITITKGLPRATIRVQGKRDKRYRVSSGQYQNQFKYKFVVGSFDKRDGNRWQLVGHRRTGWYRLRNITDRWFGEYTRRVQEQFARLRAIRKNK